jgi:type IV secretion system protein TrbG
MEKRLYCLLIYACLLLQGCAIVSWEGNGGQKGLRYLTGGFLGQEEAERQSAPEIKPAPQPKLIPSPKPGKEFIPTKHQPPEPEKSSPLNESLPIADINITPPDTGFTKEAPVKTQSQIIETANKKAMILPDSSTFHNAVVRYRFEENATYQIYTAVGRVTKIEFQEGDNIIKVAGGDSVNWLLEQCVVKDTPHLFVKPIYPALETNLSILTERHSYYIHLKSCDKIFMVGVEWIYPEEEEKKYNNYLEKKKRSGINDLQRNYRVESECTDCIKPASLYVDYDAGKMYITMPEQIRHSSLPVMFSLDVKRNPRLVNYRFLEDELIFVIDGRYPVLMLRYEGGKGREVYIMKVGFKIKRKSTGFFPS